MKLSDAFRPVDTKADPCLECKAIILNINLGKNSELMEKCQRLKEYAIFVDCIRRRQINGRLTKTAVAEAVEECIKNGVLADYLRKHRGEVLEVAWYEYNEEEYIKDEKDISHEEGRKEGRKEGVALINELNRLLIDAKRYDDLERAVKDSDYQKQLLEEFGL
ncbi:MAG: hypothetical protein IKU83_04485 [Lachnospiraceae bacterium]|nr:hypothetical protein [Lachnospiraceae bacterium]